MIEGSDERVSRFYAFMQDRELIRQRRQRGLEPPWTHDEVLRTFSFTNVKREHDRTTVLLKKEFYDQHTDAPDDVKLLNCSVFRFFGTIEAARMFGWSDGWTVPRRERLLAIGPAMKFTAAYIVTSAGKSAPKYETVCEFVDSIADRVHRIVAHQSWQLAVEEMTKCYGVGSFMAKEIYLDFLLATGRVPIDWTTWTPVGPGGRRGASRIRYNVPDKISEDEALGVIRDIYAIRDERWPEAILDFDDTVVELPRLDLTDVQFQLCEWDKYSRVAEGRRPKKLFRPTNDVVTRGGRP